MSPHGSVTVAPESAVLEHAPDALVVFEDAALAGSWKLQAAALLGWSAEEAIGRPLGSLLAPAEDGDGGRDAIAALLEALGHADRTPIQLRTRRQDGRTVAVGVKVARVPGDAVDRRGGVIWVLRPAKSARLE